MSFHILVLCVARASSDLRLSFRLSGYLEMSVADVPHIVYLSCFLVLPALDHTPSF